VPHAGADGGRTGPLASGRPCPGLPGRPARRALEERGVGVWAGITVKRALVQAAWAALEHPEIAERTREKYRRRARKLAAALQQVGFKAKMPAGTYLLYTRAPKGCAGRNFANAEEVSQFLIAEQSVCCVPWDDAGPYLRFSLTYLAPDEAAEDALMAETVARLGRLKLEF
jgi:LL-diaminopimelate aminotransferase